MSGERLMEKVELNWTLKGDRDPDRWRKKDYESGWALADQDREVPQLRVCDCSFCNIWLNIYRVRLYCGESLQTAGLVNIQKISKCKIPYQQVERKKNMIMSIDEVKTFEKVNNHHEETLSKCGTEGNFLKLIKDHKYKSLQLITYLMVKDKCLRPRVGDSAKCIFSLFLFNIVLEVQASTVG